MALETELTFFNAHKDELLKTHAGQFVLVKGSELIGTYTTAAQAYEVAVQRFGNSPVLIRQVLEQEQRAGSFALTFGLISAHVQ